MKPLYVAAGMSLLSGLLMDTSARAQSACAEGRVANEASQGYCCWPNQRWSDRYGRCVGPPSCPSGYAAAGENCIASERPATPAQPAPVVAVRPPSPPQYAPAPAAPMPQPAPAAPVYATPRTAPQPTPFSNQTAPGMNPVTYLQGAPAANNAPPASTEMPATQGFARASTFDSEAQNDSTNSPVYRPVFAERRREVEEPYNGGDVPPGMQIATRRRGGLIAGGAVLFGLGYVAAATTGGFAVGSSDQCVSPVGWAMVPLLGPLIAPAAVSGVQSRSLNYDGTYSYYHCSNAGVWWGLGITDLVLQVGGFAMLIAGVLPHRVLVHGVEARNEERGLQWALVPSAPGATVGLSFIGTHF